MSGERQEQLSRIVIKGYKSIKECDIDLNNINVLIGSNGAGKSNFVSVFSLLQAMLDGELDAYGAKKGASTLFHNSPKVTECVSLHVFDGGGRNSVYEFTMSENNTLVRSMASHHGPLGSLEKDMYRQSQRQWRVYHFHDTSPMAKIKQENYISNGELLQKDASNLSAFLFRLKEHYAKEYADILETLQLIAPYFKDFVLKPQGANKEQIFLRWQQKGCDDTFFASQLSDGTLRFICLAALLLQPAELQPATIIIDEPELGLHPFAITIFAELVKKTAVNKQIILSTQSVELLNHFEVDDVIVVDRDESGSQLKRLDSARLEEWLEDDYTLGDLWNKNIFGGRFAK